MTQDEIRLLAVHRIIDELGGIELHARATELADGGEPTDASYLAATREALDQIVKEEFGAAALINAAPSGDDGGTPMKVKGMQKPDYTNDEKELAFEWLRQRALSTEEDARLACIALSEWGDTSKDAERLRFAESKAATIYCSESGHWVFVDERKKTRSGTIGPNGIRSCIDAAMQSERGPQKERP